MNNRVLILDFLKMKVDIEMFLITKRKVIGRKKMGKKQNKEKLATIIKWAWVSHAPDITTIFRNALFTDR